jgi:hypothetical protein
MLSPMQQALEQIEQLLRGYGHTYEANLAAIARNAFERDRKAACRALNSDEWWSSSRSLAAIDLAMDGGYTTRSRQDSQALRRSMIEIFTIMRAYGEHNESAEILVAQFHKWLGSRI